VFFGVLKEINICLNRVNPPLNSGFIIRKHFLKKDVINKNIRCSKLLSDLILLESREGPSLIYKRLSVLA
jgi:hypothetical protein